MLIVVVGAYSGGAYNGGGVYLKSRNIPSSS